ncbi:hypothetical protein AB0L13_04675 [Saccharopolyspora shandongensis]|uniref:Rv0361 family membrane protein n=1 Tax=Saccharopolyspora shandongensis TaxID=418495 RepID=UPI003422011F
MTYPPQQPPGQDGWGQQPGGQYPPSGGQPQQGFGGQPGGAYPPSGGQPQQGGAYPQSGPQPQQGFGQQPPYPPQGGGFGQPGFDAPKKKSPLPWILGGVGGLLVIGLVITLVIVFTGGPGDPRKVAQQGIDAINQKDFATLQTLACQKDKEEFQKIIDGMEGKGGDFDGLEEAGLSQEDIKKFIDSLKFDARLGEVKDNGDNTATAKVSITMSASGTIMGRDLSEMPAQTEEQEFKMVVEGGDWKLC